MIREARKEDFGELIRMCSQFAQRAKTCQVDPDSFVKTVICLINGVFGVKSTMLVIDHDGRAVGMLGLSVYPSWLNAEQLISQEIVWWVDEDHRGRESIRLFEAGERWASESGSQFHLMGSRAQDSRVESGLERFYRRRGYEPIETMYGKRLHGDNDGLETAGSEAVPAV